jgi:hypothetical protein
MTFALTAVRSPRLRRLSAVSAWSVLLLGLVPAQAAAQSLEPPPPLPSGGSPVPSAGALPPATPTTASNEQAEDSGLGLEWVYLNAEVGGAYVNMQSFSANNLALKTTEDGGPAVGVAAGVRLLFLSLGVRARDLLLSTIGSLWELSLEGALHTRIWHIDPYFGVRGGYNFVGSLNGSTVQVATGGSPSDVSVHGFNIGPMVGIDVYFSKLVSLGADVDAQFLFLQRPAPPLPAGLQPSMLPAQYQALYNESGSSVGFGVTGAAHLGIHF